MLPTPYAAKFICLICFLFSGIAPFQFDLMLFCSYVKNLHGSNVKSIQSVIFREVLASVLILSTLIPCFP